MFARARRRRGSIVGVALVFAALAMAAKAVFPGNYVATEQLLFDPVGLEIFAVEPGAARADSNAQINFVESQMGVILSERVLSRVIARECARAGDDAPPPNFQKLCPRPAPAADSSKAIESLRKLVAVKRAERSFLVDVAASGATPSFAAELARAVVDAYIAEDSATRAAAANRLTGELNGRIEALRKAIAESEAQAEGYRGDKNLVRVGDTLLVEQKLTDASAALDAARNQLERSRARLAQLETTPRDATGRGALGDETETHALGLLLDRRAAALAELAPLQTRLGARHPLLVEARGRVAEIDRDIAAEVKSIRAAAREQFERAQRERENFAREVGRLTGELTQARRAQIALRTLEQGAEANRKLLESFENRSRQAAEMGRIDLANLRVASEARAPEARLFVLTEIVWGVVGLIVGLAAALGGIALLAMRGVPTPAPREGPHGDALSDALARDLARVSASMRREYLAAAGEAYP
jgi:uncharacterized protein involved in exopolysaccharide biosynthesis